ncbi:hypothetical protein B0H21DRAFT_538944 [Amylocystis lapponica]|nr:hypothetical protein B0H21DRAFT_538944 [Amylocystis lapponica]
MIIGKDEGPLVPEKDIYSNVNPDIVVNRAGTSDEPPPYEAGRAYMSNRPATTPAARPRPTLAPPRHPLASARSTSVFQSGTTQRVNDISLFSRDSPISGMYLVDPLLPTPALVSGFASARKLKNERRERSVERKHAKNMGHESRSRWFGRARAPIVNAAFRTRQSAITLEVAVVGSPVLTEPQGQTSKMRGRVMASSRHGNISVNLFELHHSRNVDLDVSTRSGNIVVLLPLNFNGTVCVRQRNGGANLLPQFAARMRLVRATDREKLMVLDGGDLADAQNQNQADSSDHCVIGTRHGKVMIGLSGLDVVPRPVSGGGLLKLIGDYVQAGAKAIEQSLIGK